MEWISTKDRLPKKRTPVLIFNIFNSGRIEIAMVFHKYVQNKETVVQWCSPTTGFIFGGQTTHWMPLPNNPPAKGFL